MSVRVEDDDLRRLVPFFIGSRLVVLAVACVNGRSIVLFLRLLLPYHALKESGSLASFISHICSGALALHCNACKGQTLELMRATLFRRHFGGKSLSKSKLESFDDLPPFASPRVPCRPYHYALLLVVRDKSVLRLEPSRSPPFLARVWKSSFCQAISQPELLCKSWRARVADGWPVPATETLLLLIP
jgi:hypothetical protein